jgi:PAS domain S-box-containing protein
MWVESMASEPEAIRVLHVDDQQSFVELAARFLEREDDRFEVVTAASVTEGVGLFVDDDFDCIVSDYNMPDRDGLEFLEIVRERDPTTPFILFSGEESKDLAGEAAAAGATYYVQKGMGTDQYSRLAARIKSAVEQARTRSGRLAANLNPETAINRSVGVVYQARNKPGRPVVSLEGNCKGLCGYPASKLEAHEIAWNTDIIHPDDRLQVQKGIQDAVERGEPFELTYRIRTSDGNTVWVQDCGQAIERANEDSTLIEGFISEVTPREELEQGVGQERSPNAKHDHESAHDHETAQAADERWSTGDQRDGSQEQKHRQDGGWDQGHHPDGGQEGSDRESED